MSSLTPVATHSENPHTMIALIGSIESMEDTRLSRDMQQTRLSVNTAMQTLGKRFQALSEHNARLRTQLTHSVKLEREMAKKRELEIATLQQRVEAAKEALEVLKNTVAQANAENKQKVLIAITKQAKAIKKTTQTSRQQVTAVRKQAEGARIVALSQQKNVYQPKILEIIQAFKGFIDAYRADQEQLDLQHKASIIAFDQAAASCKQGPLPDLPKFRHMLRQFLNTQTYSYKCTTFACMRTHYYINILENILKS